MAQAAKEGDTVKVHYTGKLTDGTTFDTSTEREPLEFTIGDNQIISGFEQAVLGMSPGDTKTVTIPSDDAYGPRFDELEQTIDRSNIPEGIPLQVGIQLQAVGPDNQPIILTVTDVMDDTVKVDANHPLAGKDLMFDIELVAIG